MTRDETEAAGKVAAKARIEEYRRARGHMPRVACGTCRHWIPPFKVHVDGSRTGNVFVHGTCLPLTRPDGFDWPTREDYRCRQWKAIPTPSSIDGEHRGDPDRSPEDGAPDDS